MRISVLVSMYNEEKNILGCIDSIMKNKYQDFEVIIGVDDGQDRTHEIALDLEKKYNNLRVFHSPKQIGITAMFKNMLAISSGDIIVKFDADHMFSFPEVALEKIVRHFDNPKIGGIGIIYENIGYCNEETQEFVKRIKEETLVTRGFTVIDNVVDAFKLNWGVIKEIPDFQIHIDSFRKSAIKDLDMAMIHDDAVFAYTVLESGYYIEPAPDVGVIHIGIPATFKKAYRRFMKGHLGWRQIDEKYPLDMKKYYWNLAKIYSKMIWKYDYKYVLGSFIYLFAMFSSLALSKFKKSTIQEAWSKKWR